MRMITAFQDLVFLLLALLSGPSEFQKFMQTTGSLGYLPSLHFFHETAALCMFLNYGRAV